MEKIVEVEKNMHESFITTSDKCIHMIYERGERVEKDQLRIGEQFKIIGEGVRTGIKGQVIFVVTGKSKDLRWSLRYVDDRESNLFLNLGEEVITVIAYDLLIPNKPV